MIDRMSYSLGVQLLIAELVLFGLAMTSDLDKEHAQRHAQAAAGHVGVHPHNHHHHKFGAKEDLMDEDHIKLHLKDNIDMTHYDTNQAHFYYFNLHNLNKDPYIDGLEIAKGLTHSHDGEPLIPMNDDEIENMVDSVMKDFDKNGDGLVEYGEYLEATKHLNLKMPHETKNG